MKRIYAAIVLTIYLFTPSILMAQSVTADLSIDVVPTNPNPGQTVTLTAQSYGADLSQASMVWTYNNTVVARGIGKTSIILTAPGAGAAGVITATMEGSGLQEGVSYTTVIRPASSDLLWEAADAYTPPFYKGKALLPVGGLIRVTAIPSAGAPKALSYSWSRNNSAMQAESGFGKSSITFRNNALNAQEKIDLSINSGTFSGTNILRLSPTGPLVAAYENREGFIDYANGHVSDITLNKTGAIFHFEPYYFSTPNNSITDLEIDTTIDGDHIVPSQQNEIAISKPESGVRSSIALAITTVSYSLQHLEKTFSILFN